MKTMRNLLSATVTINALNFKIQTTT